MLALSVVSPLVGSAVLLAATNLESYAMYGLVALLVGLIAWSKYVEAAPSDPYAKRGPSSASPSFPDQREAAADAAAPGVAADASTPRR